MPEVYGIECMKLGFTDESETCHITLLRISSAGNGRPLFCCGSKLFGGIISFTLSGGIINTGLTSRNMRITIIGCIVSATL